LQVGDLEALLDRQDRAEITRASRGGLSRGFGAQTSTPSAVHRLPLLEMMPFAQSEAVR
jgi:hypothetical protein